MKNNPCPYLLTIILLFALSCKQEPAFSGDPPQQIQVGPGPEDMVLDHTDSQARLLISCSARRDVHKPYGEIVSLNLSSRITTELIRYNEPGNLLFRPHGIYLDQDLLYVISHEREPDYHPILIYRLHGDSLGFLELIHTPDQHSPNALVTGPGGEIYLVNDSGKRGSIAEKALKLKKASVVRLKREVDRSWKSKVVADKLGYPAGINRMGSNLYVGDAVLHRIHVFSIRADGLNKVGEIRDLKGNDNLRMYNNQILTPGHIKPFKFIGHTKDPGKHSPVDVYLVDPDSGDTQLLYHTDGSQISGGSTAVIFEDHLYISQVFEPFILSVELN